MKTFDGISKRLVLNNRNEGRIKRDLVSLMILGFIDDRNMFLGLWQEVLHEIRHKITTSNEGEELQAELFRALKPFAVGWAKDSEQPFEGVYTNDDISFNYSIDYQFKGIYPEWVTLQIDLTPMKDRLYKVIKNENKNN